MKNSIVTKTGDDGKTFILSGMRLPKNHIRIKSYGESDELNSVLGLASSSISDNKILSILNNIQNQIFELGAILATPEEAIDKENKKKHSDLISNFINFLEGKISELEPQLPELKNFILPGGNLGSSFLQLARTVCRRVERTIIDLNDLEKINSLVVIYFNRLSDMLFILARFENYTSKVEEKIWKSTLKK
jgi:cob(I)alamin adenosyltransferase